VINISLPKSVTQKIYPDRTLAKRVMVHWQKMMCMQIRVPDQARDQFRRVRRGGASEMMGEERNEMKYESEDIDACSASNCFSLTFYGKPASHAFCSLAT
jgi:hypothetical protein